MPDQNKAIDENQWDHGLRSAFAAPLPPPVSLNGGAVREPTPRGPHLLRSKFGRLQVLCEIARGGVGIVYRAHDPSLGRDVAVKVLHEELAGNAPLVRRFIEEAQIGGQLQHPGIVPVHEIGLDDGHRPYFAMKLVEGRTLAALLRDERDASDHPRLLRVFEQVCETVAYAHSRGVVHRDLKPANIMVGAFGEVQVMDWGFAKVLCEATRGDSDGADSPRADSIPGAAPLVATVRSAGAGRSQAGSAFGTPSYMAPEQARGEIERVDERTDVFALGAILLEVLTDRPPYPRDAGLGVAARADLEPALDALAKGDHDHRLDDMVQSCLAIEPAGRPRDAGTVAAAMRAHFEATEERARRAGVAAAASEARALAERRARRLTLALSLAVLVAFAIAGGIWWSSTLADTRMAEQLRQARAGADKLADNGQIAEALAELARAAGLAQALGEREQSRELAAQRIHLEQVERERGLELTLIRARAEPGPPDRLDHELDKALADYGLDAEQRRPEHLVETLASAPAAVASAVARVLEYMAIEPLPRWRFDPLQIADGLDADPLRTRIRQALRAEDGAALSTTAHELDPAETDADTLVLLGRSLARCGRLDDAIDLLEAAADHHVDDLWIHIELAQWYRNRRPPDLDAADLHARMAALLHPDGDWDPRRPRGGRPPGPEGRRPMGGRGLLRGQMRRAHMLLEHGDYRGLADVLRDVLARDPEHRRARDLVQEALRRLGNSDARTAERLRALLK